MVTGRKPKDDDQRRNHHSLTHDWTEVADVPFRGAPTLGRRPGGEAWPSATQTWWKAVTAMPHCCLWRAPSWEYARVTALVHAAVIEGELVRAQELRVREAAMGTTDDARRALRLRYVPAGGASSAGAKVDDEVARARSERRRRLSGEPA